VRTTFAAYERQVIMTNFSVQMERLEPFQVAAVAITSPSPEADSLNRMLSWARPQGLLDGSFRIFGYDNCRPDPDHTYTLWLSLDHAVAPSEGMTVKAFPGGLYAVTEIQGVEQISSTWKQLAQWCSQNGYQLGDQPCLEEHLNTLGDCAPQEMQFKLYHSIKE
jgi:DNA gyrase inhibitor GyrI